MSFTKTKNLLEVSFPDGTSVTSYTFKAPSNIKSNWQHIIEREDYYVEGLYSGDIRRYYKDGKTVIHINTVTNETFVVENVTFRIYEDKE